MVKIKLSKIFFLQKYILMSLDLAFYSGQIISFYGESGCGKTTLLNTIACRNDFLLKYYVNDQDILKMSDKDKKNYLFHHIGYVTQEPELLDDLTIRNHMKQISEIYQINMDTSKIINKLEIGKLLDKYPNQLSGGEKFRCALLLCIMKNTDIILLDEPTAALEDEQKKIVIELLEYLASKGKTIIISTHDDLMMKHSDVSYEIKNQEIICVKNSTNIEDGGPLKRSCQKNTKVVTDYMFKMEKHHPWYYGMLRGLSIFCIIFCALSLEFSNYAYEIDANNMKSTMSNELTVYKRLSYFDEYDLLGTNEPITHEEVDFLKNLEHVERVEWRLDTGLGTNLLSVSDENYLSEDNELADIRLFNESKQIIKDRTKDNIYACTYLHDENYDSFIEYQFNNEGIYLSKDLANSLTDDLSSLKGKYINFQMPIPEYDSYGFAWIYDENEQEVLIHVHAGSFEELTLPIAGVLKGADMGLYTTFGELMYIDRDVIEPLIEKHKKTESRTIYTMLPDSKVFYINELPENEKENVAHTVVETPWEPTGYTVIVDDIDHLDEVIQNIREAGLRVDSQFASYKSISESTKNLQKAVKMISKGMLVILLCIYLVIKYNNRIRERKINQYYMLQLNFTKNEIRKVKLKRYLENTIIAFMISFIIFMILIFLFDYIGIGFTVLNKKIVFTFICASVILEFIVPIIFERKMGPK
ncbi:MULTISPECIES: ATP-binding cassette domain-containing protein [Bacillota]|uniref:ATP-binding cassette domain-containing protein n=2 Tax=Amedibacillus TaxID=2749846 RepID=A0A7G9GSB4_9FIRM|nr:MULTISPECIES: ATP-binding cassette domain-containing protein [Bacillota]MCH4283671.1 ATP-binding cassette domain-containing protein [Amedibacillus hominis]QNM13696.1 ATP-binding cassette domain-containing protein [[Eubacterium] hominis]RGB56480.1 ATP-binding cassette domain-containing protein [Absiella sp. AM10-20]RGB56643.1 ATP-binding cassette domain-containing protein [Absiella sp. AM22-9]RGB64729.1 ATP-binding cassette domain-containing protein [Absiella sp. AM09-45]